MVTSVIGKIFLEAYNEKHNKAYTPKSFFVEVYYPIFFANEKYLIWIQNSAIVQKLKKEEIPQEDNEKTRQEKIVEIKKNKLIDKIESAEFFDASIAVGYKAERSNATTSGQTCIHNYRMKTEEAYLSWIGAGLGVGIGEAGAKNKESELTILFSKPDILLDIAEGWEWYRKYLDTTPGMKGNQINTWNGQWLKRKYDINDSSSLLDFDSAFSNKEKKGEKKSGLVEIETLSWIELITAVSLYFPDPRMMGYVYKMDKMNKTIGFIPFVLSSTREVNYLYKKHFGTEDEEKAMKLFGTAFGFSMACKEGVIGLKALEPEGLSSIMMGKEIPSYKQKEKLKYETYQIWLLAMLNNEELWNRANEFARALDSFRKGQGKDRTNRDNAIEELLAHPSKQSVVRNVYPILKDAEEEERETIMDVIKIIHDMPAENVPYFIALTKIHHVILR
ncbi:hypothetical protein [Porphyromonas endodontalis]|uniref:hypothetical protein n=1 Tax=Porphyromonas endodontalis TaxID=28124 RepID=UPI0028EDF21C|nr:hypothetical protein [Porphyromonas endodontalis]